MSIKIKKGRKVALFLIAITIIFSFAFNSVFASDLDFTFHAGSVGGTFFIMAAAFSDAFTEFIDGFHATQVPGSSFGNTIKVSGSKRDLAIATAPNLEEAWKGTGQFKDENIGEIRNVRALSNLGYGNINHFVVVSEKVPEGVRTLGEFLETKPAFRVSMGPRGNAGEVAARNMLELLGVTYDDIREWGGSVIFTDYSDAISSIMDGHLDALFNNFPPYHPGLTELTTSRDVEMLSVDEEVLEIFETERSRPRALVEAGTYPNIDYDWYGAFEFYMAICNEDLEEELAYEMTKIILENKERWTRAFIGMESFDPSKAWVSPIPLHEGSERAFKELGYIE